MYTNFVYFFLYLHSQSISVSLATKFTSKTHDVNAKIAKMKGREREKERENIKNNGYKHRQEKENRTAIYDLSTQALYGAKKSHDRVASNNKQHTHVARMRSSRILEFYFLFFFYPLTFAYFVVVYVEMEEWKKNSFSAEIWKIQNNMVVKH